MNDWRPLSGIFILVNLKGPLATRIHEIQERFDPRMARFAAPHFTLSGSSGAGPIPADTPVARLHAALGPIARDTAPFETHFEKPVRYMGTNTFALPLDPHGALRELHDRIRKSGLDFAASRHAFTPHVTLSHYRTPTDAEARELLAIRVDEPLVVDHMVISLTEEPALPRRLFDLVFTGQQAAGSRQNPGATSAP